VDVARKSRKVASRTGGLLRGAALLVVVFLLFNLILIMVGIIATSWKTEASIPISDLLAEAMVELPLYLSITIIPILGVVTLLMVVLMLEVTVHELGHVIAGKAAGFRFVLLVIGPLRLSREGRNLKLGLRDAWDPHLGAALSVPTDSHDLRARTALSVAGGPAASLALGLTSALLAIAFSNGDWLGELFRLSAWVSLLSAFINMLPLKSGGMMSDGARIKMLLAGGAASERYCLITALSGAARAGQRPRDWDETWMQRIGELADGSLDDAAASHIAFYRLLDKGDIDGAERTLERLLATANAIPAALHPILHAEAAFFYAFYRRDLEKARSFLHKVGDRDLGSHYHMNARAQAAVLSLEGKHEAAQEKAASGLAHMERKQTRGPGWELDYEWLQALVTASPSM